jgi:nucleotide-binding universal stress UspA family protein
MVWTGNVKGTLIESAQQEATKAMQAFLDETGLAGNAAVTTAIVEGAPGPAILQAAEAGGFDAIVMGTHGRTGLSHLVLGSVAERVVRYAKCPVLTIRAVMAAPT